MTAAAHVSSDTASKAAAASQFASRPPVVLSDIAESLDTCRRSDAHAAALESTFAGKEPSSASDATGVGWQRGPTEYRTDFQAVANVLGASKLPPKTRICKNRKNRAWFAAQDGRTVRGSHAAISLHASEEAAISHAFSAVRAAMLSVLCAQPIPLFAQLTGREIRVQALEHAWLASVSALARSSSFVYSR